MSGFSGWSGLSGLSGISGANYSGSLALLTDIVKPFDTTRTSATLVSDPDLFVALQSGYYWFESVLRFTTPDAAGTTISLQYAFDGTLGDIVLTGIGTGTTTLGGTVRFEPTNQFEINALNTPTQPQAISLNFDFPILIKGWINVATPGTLYLQWGSDGTHNLTLKVDSYQSTRQGSGAISGYSGYSGLGFSGASGFSSQSGTSGYSGFSGTFSGFSGWSGVMGESGPSGPSGYSGFSGYSGTGLSGFSGAGQSGYSGFSGLLEPGLAMTFMATWMGF